MVTNTPSKVLVTGTSALCRLFAAQLHRSGVGVTLIARDEDYKEIDRYGVIQRDVRSGELRYERVPVLAQPSPTIEYDLIIWFAEGIGDNLLAQLAQVPPRAPILLIVNHVFGYEAIREAVGSDRILLGHAGALGLKQGHQVNYMMGARWLPATTIGELQGANGDRARAIQALLNQAGLRTDLCANITAWLQTYQAFWWPLAATAYLAQGDASKLAATQDSLVLLSRAIREGLRTLKSRHVPIVPAGRHLIAILPEPWTVRSFRRLIQSRPAGQILVQHLYASAEEMLSVASLYRTFTLGDDYPTPALAELLDYCRQDGEVLAEGSANLSMNRRSLWLGASVITGVLTVLIARFLYHRLPPTLSFPVRDYLPRPRSMPPPLGGTSTETGEQGSQQPPAV